MNYDNTQFPISPATDNIALLQQLGYFWRRIFRDRTAVTGLIQSQTSGAEQNYVDIWDAVAGYSTANIPLFSQINWYPITIAQTDLNSALTYGESVTFSQQVSGSYYEYGEPVPEQNNVYSVIAPAGLRAITIAADQIINPAQTWVVGQNIQLSNNRIYFYGNPIPDGKQSITLWFYNAQVDAKNLYDNFGFLFGLNIDDTLQSKAILAAMVDILINGASINSIQTLGLACLNSTDATRMVVEDQCVKKNWWQTDFTVSPAGTPVNLPLRLPPYMFLTGYQHALQFVNSSEPVNLVGTSYIAFPVQGSARDVQLFNNTINSDPGFFVNFNNYIVNYGSGGALVYGSNTSAMINPVDFIFRSLLGSATTLVHATFDDFAELSLFGRVFAALKHSLPKHVWLLFVCEINAVSEVYPFSSDNVSDVIQPNMSGSGNNTYYPLNDEGVIQEQVYMNTAGGSGLLVKDMLLRRTLPSSPHITSEDLNNLSFTKSAV